MLPNEIFEKLRSVYGDQIIELIENHPSDSFITVNASALFEICHSLRDEAFFMFDYLMSLTGMDLGENLGVVYHLYSMQLKHKIVIKAFVPKEQPNVLSVERIWRTADWHEREAYDLIGVNFEGHHNLIRILLPYDWEGYPLRKDYTAPEMYHGMKVS
jgi:NADH-quinone oxidoreductase subunit C